jgi:hypothetical protein
MSTRRERPRLLLLAGFGVAALCAMASVALGFVDIYQNGFNNRPQFREVKALGGGNKCDREHKEKRGVMEVVVRDGPRACSFKPPVQGNQSSPDHRFDAAARIIRDTPKALRKDAYLAIAVRVGGGARYQLRIFPKDKEFDLRRKPNGAMFPVAGPNSAVKGMGKLNKMALIAEGNRVRAIVNGTELADVTDPNPNEVNGRRLDFGVGTLKDTKKNTLGNFDRLSVGVPNP